MGKKYINTIEYITWRSDIQSAKEQNVYKLKEQTECV